MIGILGQKALEQHETGITLVQAAAINEYGSDDGHIPERPAHRTAFDKHRKGLSRRLAGSVRLIGQGTPVQQQMDKLGWWYVGQLKNEIQMWNDPENAKATVKKKGFNNPLIHHGRTVNAIHHVLRKAGSGGAQIRK
ncbi:MAG: hypothetical protein IGS03_00640 [Candidatus Sericytochromatia bacterium]|nr:hypothetical protein [Candidatus Sericytochromatia bacterium]